MDMLSLFNEATKESEDFEEHPISFLTLEDKILYLQGLAMVMYDSGDEYSKKFNYYRILVKSFGLDESVIEDLIDFANAPDQESIQDFIQCYRGESLSELFLIDALIVMDLGENWDITPLVLSIANQLGVNEIRLNVLRKRTCLIARPRHFREIITGNNVIHDVPMEYISHLIAHYEVQFNKAMRGIENELFNKDLTWRPINNSAVEIDYVVSNEYIGPLADIYTNRNFYRLLQRRIELGEIRVHECRSLTLFAEIDDVTYFNIDPEYLCDLGLMYDPIIGLSIDDENDGDINKIIKAINYLFPSLEGADLVIRGGCEDSINNLTLLPFWPFSTYTEEQLAIAMSECRTNNQMILNERNSSANGVVWGKSDKGEYKLLFQSNDRDSKICNIDKWGEEILPVDEVIKLVRDRLSGATFPQNQLQAIFDTLMYSPKVRLVRKVSKYKVNE